MNKAFLFVLSLLFILGSCTRHRLDVDLSGVEIVPLHYQRLDRDLFTINADNIDPKTQELLNKYGRLYDHYLMNPLGVNGTGDSLYKQALLNFLGDREIRGMYSQVRRMYPDATFEKMMPELNDCVRRFKYHFPHKPLPKRLVTCVSGWNFAFANLDSTLLLSLDMYMGDTTLFYRMLRYPQYQVRKMNQAHMLSDIARGWLLTEFDNNPAQNNLLSHTIFYGKLYYAVNALLPDEADSIIIGYTRPQMDYCRTYEKNLWGYMASQNRLYENNLNTIRELTSEGPFTGAISKDCPPRIAMWIGWQIVRSYMERNENVSLSELMAEQDAQKILNKSKYRP